MATLTPAELATLLGPQSVSEVAIAPAPIPTGDDWNGFAERFAKSLTSQLRTLVRSAARVQPGGVMRMCAETALSETTNSVLAEVWQVPESEETLAVSLSARLVASFVDRLLGGGTLTAGDESAESRALSETDRQFAARLIDAIRESFVGTTHSDASPGPQSITRLATPLTDAWLPDCELVRFQFEVRFIQGGGSFGMLLPREFAERFRDEPQDVVDQRHDDAASDRAMTSARTRPCRVSVRLAQTSLSATDLHRLAIGDVLLTEADVGQPCEVLIDGHPRFLAEPGQLNGRKAAQLLRSLTDY